MAAGMLFSSGNSMEEWKRSVHISVVSSRQREDMFKSRMDQMISAGYPRNEAFDLAWNEFYGSAYTRD